MEVSYKFVFPVALFVFILFVLCCLVFLYLLVKCPEYILVPSLMWPAAVESAI